MSHFVYIAYSKSIDEYYIGETSDIAQRIIQHNTGFYTKSYTSKAVDWEIKYELECPDISCARKIEKHIKQMKSRKYVEDTIKYYEISVKLLNRYS